MSEENIESNNANKAAGAVDQEESFADLLEKNRVSAGRLHPGQKVKAKVVSVSGDLVYIDLGGKSEGAIDLNEFKSESEDPAVREGDEIEAFFVTVQDGVMKLTTLINGYSAVTLNAIRDAFKAGVPVNGEVKREVKGGFEVSVGGVRCFCPFSQIDMKGGREGGIYLGRTFPFKVLEYEKEGKNIVVSRRVLLEQEKQARIDNLKKDLSVGMDITCTVSSVQNFGAFVDLGGVDGLIPVSELSWERVGKPSDLLATGQEVTARIISLDWENSRLTLSLKAMLPDPWLNIAEKYPEDGKVTGTIVRLAPFGVFVNLEPGVDGLVHISNLGAGRRINHPKEVVETGQSVEAYVLAVDEKNRRISLSLQPKPKPETIVLPSIGETVDGVVEKVMPFGIFIRMNNGLSGLIPNADSGTPAGSDRKQMFPSGMEIQAIVTEIDSSNQKIRLSRKAVMDKKSREEFEEYKESASGGAESSSGFGSLGEILKAKMEEKKRSGQDS